MSEENGAVAVETKPEAAVPALNKNADERVSVDIRRTWTQTGKATLIHDRQAHLFYVEITKGCCGEKTRTAKAKWPGKAIKAAYEKADSRQMRLISWRVMEG